MRKNRFFFIPLFALVGFFFVSAGVKEYGVKKIEIVSKTVTEAVNETKEAVQEKMNEVTKKSQQTEEIKEGTEEIIFPDLATLQAVATPEKIKAIYVTAEVAMLPSFFDKLITLASTTPINAMVINVKDSNRSHFNAKMTEIARKARENGIYPIARIVVFQDNELVAARPELALKTKDGKLWGKNEYHFVDAASREVWEYNLKAAKDALRMGFLEVNLDYIRFPDGDVNSIVYPVYDGKTPKKEIINEFSRFMMAGVKKEFPQATVSADIFAYTLLDPDVGIGQSFPDLMQIYDVIAPMIYPSHYTAGNFGFKNPAEHPYEVVKETLLSGKRMLTPKPVVVASSTATGTTSTVPQMAPEPIPVKAVMRPWIQDFDLGAYYTKEMIEAQVKAIEDVGYHSGWMSWNPRVNYIEGEYVGL